MFMIFSFMNDIVRRVRWAVPVAAAFAVAIGGPVKADILTGASDAYSLKATLNTLVVGPIAEVNNTAPIPYNNNAAAIGASVQVPGSGIGAGAVVNLNLGALTDNVFSNVNGGPGVHTTTADSTVANASLSVLLGTVVSFSATAINQHAAITGDYGALAGSSVLTVTDLTLSILGTSIYSNFTGTIAANTSINLSTGLGSVSLLLNEQILSGDGISGRGVVSNAFHLNATALGLVNSDVIIGHAEAFETAGPSAVPEPASLALMGLGVLGAGLAGLRKRSAA